MTEGAEVDRNGLGVAEQERRPHQQQQSREQNGPERVDVFEGIERHAAEAPSGIIAAQSGHISVCRFMERDRNDQGDGPDRDRVNDGGVLLEHWVLGSVGQSRVTAANQRPSGPKARYGEAAVGSWLIVLSSGAINATLK